MAIATAYQGGCHCGKVRFDVQADLSATITCNCSICEKTGMILTFVPEQNFTLTSGADDLVDYQFNKKVIHHLFCGVCGVRAFGRGTAPDGRQMVAVNVRCLDGVDLAAITPKQVDGRKF
ncbi:MAG: GFA family protein [Hyphomicrobium sp.]